MHKTTIFFRLPLHPSFDPTVLSNLSGGIFAIGDLDIESFGFRESEGARER